VVHVIIYSDETVLVDNRKFTCSDQRTAKPYIWWDVATNNKVFKNQERETDAATKLFEANLNKHLFQAVAI
jgi:hypothetical protein